MSTARELADFLIGVKAADLPAQAMEHAAMLVASTLASAAMGSTLESSKIVKDARLQIYPGAPHGLMSTHKEQFNADLLSFLGS